MKLRRSLLGLLSLVCSVSIFAMACPMTAFAEVDKNATYTYTVRVHLADADTDNDGQGDAGAYFITDETGKELLKEGAITVADKEGSAKSDVQATVEGDCLYITGLNYGANLTINIPLVADVKLDENNYAKYHIKGIRQSGSNDVSKPSFEVTKDADYVIAYSVGNVVPYKVRYVDSKGNSLADEETFYGPEGETIYVSYKYLEGYVPNTFNYMTHKLKAPTEGEDGELTYTVFEFKYELGSISIGGTETVYTRGGINYVYVTLPGETTTITTTGGNGGNAANAGGNAENGEAAEGEDNTDDASETIGEDQTPASGPEDVISIDDEETAKSGGNNSGMVFPVFAWVIVAVAAATLIALFVVMKKNKPKKSANMQSVEDKTDK